jgi:hypothetical protein
MARNANLAWQVQVEQEYGTRFIRAHVVSVQPSGELHGLSGAGMYPFDEGYEFADFRVTAYIGQDPATFGQADPNPNEIWGISHEFAPFRVERIERAAAMHSVFRKIARGFAKAESESGYVNDGDFHAYLLRVGSAVGIRTYYVRNGQRARNTSGEVFRKVTPSTLQWFVGDITKNGLAEHDTVSR